MRLGHLIPGEVQFGDRKVLGVKGQHVARFGARRIKPGIGPLRIRIAARADPEPAGVMCGLVAHVRACQSQMFVAKKNMPAL